MGHARRATVALAAPLMLLLAACGGTSHAASPAPSSKAAPASAPAPRIAAATIAPASIDPAAVEEFGRAKAQAGYGEMVALAGRVSFQASLLHTRADGSSWEAEEFDTVPPLETPSAAAGFRDMVQKALDGDPQSASILEGISYFNLGGPGVTYYDNGPEIVNHTISNGQVLVDRSTGVPRLQVSFQENADFRIKVNGRPAVMHMDKTMTFHLVPGGAAHDWLIENIDDKWTGKRDTSAAG